MKTEKITLIEEHNPQGCLIGCLTFIEEELKVPFPLKKMSIESKVVDRIAHVDVSQSFQNPHSTPIEAVYIFPLTGNAAIHHFELKVGEQVITGEVQERKQAKIEYQQALNEGKKASILEQERDDVFTIQVGNIAPGESISVNIQYSEVLSYYENGTTALHLPLVVAPRYSPGSPIDGDSVGSGVEFDTEQVPDASRISPPRLVEGFNPEIDFKLSVKLYHGGAGIRQLSCSQHATQTLFNTEWIHVDLAKIDQKLNRDFVLKWSLAQEKLQSHLLSYKVDSETSFNLLTILPPEPKGFMGIPRDIIFVVDRSGSMEGTKMVSAAQACSLLLDTLSPSDRFAIQIFDHNIEWFEPSNGNSNKFLIADEVGLESGFKFLRKIEARGGTELEKALSGALNVFEQESSSERNPIIVLLTDGQIGNESAVLQRIQRQMEESRIFTVGIDTAVNATFLKKLANLGGGSSAFVVPGEELEGALTSFAREIGQPLMTKLSVENFESKIDRSSLTPTHLPDLFKGRAVTVLFKANYAHGIKLKGQLSSGESYEEVVNGQEVESPALAYLWARRKIRDLEDGYRLASSGEKEKIKAEMIQISIKHNILSRFTAFLAIDHSRTTDDKDKRRQVVQPVENPDGWDMLKSASPVPMMPSPMMPSAVPPLFAAAEPMALEEVCMEADGFVGDSEAILDSFDTGSLPPLSSIPPGAPRARKRGGVVNKMAESFKDFVQPKKKSRAIQRHVEASNKDTESSQSIRAFFVKVLKHFLETFSEAFELISSGQKPDLTLLSRVRQDVLSELKQAPDVSELSQTLKFVRTGSKELMAALKGGLAIDALLPIVEKHRDVLNEAINEIPLIENQENFWEAGV